MTFAAPRAADDLFLAHRYHPAVIDAENLLKDLTDPQREAATHIEGPLLIVAGAGSGKTRVITRRVAYLISQGIAPNSILAITFTNKAAGEMKHRIGDVLGRQVRDFGKLDQPWPMICTFHSLCLRILRHYAAQIGLPTNFSIFDSADQTRLLKDAVKTLDLSSTNFAPSVVHSTISNAKNQLVTAEDFARTAGDFYQKTVARIYTKYQQLLNQNNALDFDDLLLRTTRAFRDHPQILAELQQRFQYLLIDEYQDTNHAQYILAHALALKHRNICVVGDPDQCVLPGTSIATASGALPVETIQAGTNVISAIGWGKCRPMPVDHAAENVYRGKAVTVTTEEGCTLRATPNHMVFARLRADASLHYTYLMWKRSVGYRIGITRGVRASKDGEIISGLQVRANQEVADAMWILHSSTSAAEARYYEQFYSARYGIPTMVFFVRGRRMDMSQEWIDRLYTDLDTELSAERLMADLHLDPRYPHHRPGAVTRSGKGATGAAACWARRHVLFTLFGDGRDFQLKPWHEHRVQFVNSGQPLREVAASRFNVREGVRGTWRIETSRKDYDSALSLARDITSLCQDMELVPRARLTPGKAFLQMPISQIHPGMLVPTLKDGAIVESVVREVEWTDYEGPVFDLSIPNTRNYVAGGIVVHNSIYAWRGADIQNILDFEKDYPDAKIVRLEQNYRSSKTILRIASDLIANNRQRKDKRLWTENDNGERARLILCQDEHDEADMVAAELKRVRENFGYEWNQMAIFYRMNSLSRVMERALFNAQIPYQIARGVEFYGRKEIKDVLAYLRVIANPSDEVSLERIINVPTRGIGDAAVRSVQAFATGHAIGMSDALEQAGQIEGLSARAVNSIRSFVKLLKQWRESSRRPVRELMEEVLRSSGMETMLRKIGGDELEELANVNELITAAAEYDAQNPEGSLTDYLAQVSLVSDVDKLKDSGGAVTLMTLHAAKGLEFPVVAIIGLEEGCLPHARAREHPEQMEEERRLCFVGITRAQNKLILTKAAYRTMRGLRERTVTSPFLTEMPRQDLEVHDRTGLAFGSTRDEFRDRADEEQERLSTQFRRGQLVRHPTFGMGRIVEISDMGSQTRAIVEFNRAGRKTLILQYARLEAVG